MHKDYRYIVINHPCVTIGAQCRALSILFYAKVIVKISPCLKCLISSLWIPLGSGISTWWCRVLWQVTLFERFFRVGDFSADLAILTQVGHPW